jgi:hypothetical protein
MVPSYWTGSVLLPDEQLVPGWYFVPQGDSGASVPAPCDGGAEQ